MRASSLLVVLLLNNNGIIFGNASFTFLPSPCVNRLLSRVTKKKTIVVLSHHHHDREGEEYRDQPSFDISNNNNNISNRRTWFHQVLNYAGGTIAASTLPPRKATAATTTTTTIPITSPLCDPSVSTWKRPTDGRIVHLVGTAHISSDSAQLAGMVVRDIRPDAVFVELDAKRVNRALPPEQQKVKEDDDASIDPENPDGSSSSSSSSMAGGSPAAKKILKKNPFDVRSKMMQAGTQVVGDAIRGMYKKLGNEGFNPGEEFQVAVTEGLKVGSKIILGDRDVDITLRHFTEALYKTDLKKLLDPDSELERGMQELLPQGSALSSSIKNGGGAYNNNNNKYDTPPSLLTKSELTEFVETMKAKENVRKIMSQLQEVAPELYTAMVAERDEYMAEGLDRLNRFGTIVAVMGVAHVDGVERNLEGKGWEVVRVPCPIRGMR